MLVKYSRQTKQESNTSEFEYIGSLDVGTKYPRQFWKHLKTKRIACYWSISSTINTKEMEIVHQEISPRVSSLSFAKGCKKNEQPRWEIVGLDEKGNPKAVSYSHSDFTRMMKQSVILEMPFNLGDNFYKRFEKIEATCPRGSEMQSLDTSNGIF